MAPTVKEVDPLDHLEERIRKTVILFNRLREEKEAAAKAFAEERESTEKVCDALRVDLAEAKTENARLSTEIETMREERQQVRARLEKLLGHIDQLGGA
jgi:uncharacterized coiled-coil DUF342 family protein